MLKFSLSPPPPPSTHTHTYTHVCRHIHTCTHARTHACTLTHTHAHTCVHAHTHTHTHTHTQRYYIHTCTLFFYDRCSLWTLCSGLNLQRLVQQQKRLPTLMLSTDVIASFQMVTVQLWLHRLAFPLSSRFLGSRSPPLLLLRLLQ